MIKLGVKVKDRVTGFTGIVTSKVVYLNGCVQYCVKPEVNKKNEIAEGEYIDEDQLRQIGDGLLNGGCITDKKHNAEKPGGYQKDSPPMR